MGSNILNLILRFFLEVFALLSFGMWGWKRFDGVLKIIVIIAVPIFFMAVWGVFTVSNDPSRSGNTIIETPGMVRLIIELFMFSLAVAALFSGGYKIASIIFGSLVIFHYVISYDRILWLITR